MSVALLGVFVLNLLFLLTGSCLLWAIRGWVSWSEYLRLGGVAYLLGLSSVCVPATVGARLRERIEFVDASQMSESEALAGCDVIVLASEGVHTRPATLVRALAAGVVPVTSRLGVYVELLGEGRYGFAFEPGEVETLSAHLLRLVGEP